MKIKILLLSVISFVIFTSCAPTVSVNLNKDNSGTISFSTTTSNNMEKAIRSMTGSDEKQPLFNEKSIRNSVKASGLEVQSISFPTNTSIDLTMKVKDITNALPNEKNFITVNAAQKKLSIKVNPAIAKKTLKLMPSDTIDFVDLLMAPIFSDEVMNEKEYADLVSSMYGPNIANELRDANMKIIVNLPYNIKDFAISDNMFGKCTINGKKATFTVPLNRILSLNKTVEYSLTWK